MKRKTCVSGARIKVTRNGPYIVTGRVPLSGRIIVVDSGGDAVAWREGRRFPEQETYALCRCGKSKNHPFCDGAHAHVGFDGTEQASRKPYDEQAELIEGPDLDLKDAESFCASARFCIPKGGTWRLTLRSRDPEKKRTAIEQACNCPSGRLVACDKQTGAPIEPEFEPSISLIEDPHAESSGPVWAKGGVTIESADGGTYETRNRVTLCRCGGSNNKPFCDGTHVDVRFNDGDGSMKATRVKTRKSNV
jgi:CDGSH-type Zn-finger protein